MKDYLNEFKSSKVQKFQMGGPMPAPEAAPPAEAGAAPPPQDGAGGGDIEAMIAQVVETQDPNLALEVVNMLAEQAGLTAPPAAEGAPAAPPAMGAPAEGGIPQGRYGMKVPVLKARK